MFKRLEVATPVVADMVGKKIEYVRSRPYQRLPIHATGVVMELGERHGELLMRVQPCDATQPVRWISEYDFVAYVRSDEAVAAIAVLITALAGKYHSYLEMTKEVNPNLRRDFWLWAMEQRRQTAKEAS